MKKVRIPNSENPFLLKPFILLTVQLGEKGCKKMNKLFSRASVIIQLLKEQFFQQFFFKVKRLCIYAVILKFSKRPSIFCFDIRSKVLMVASSNCTITGLAFFSFSIFSSYFLVCFMFVFCFPKFDTWFH